MDSDFFDRLSLIQRPKESKTLKYVYTIYICYIHIIPCLDHFFPTSLSFSFSSLISSSFPFFYPRIFSILKQILIIRPPPPPGVKFGRIYTPERKWKYNIILNEVYTPLSPVLSGFTLEQSAGEHGVEVRGGCCYYVPE